MCLNWAGLKSYRSNMTYMTYIEQLCKRVHLGLDEGEEPGSFGWEYDQRWYGAVAFKQRSF